jgi:hypothetical protein
MAGKATPGLTESRQRLADLRALLDAQRAKAGRPPWKPGDPDRWPVYAALQEAEQRLAEPEEEDNTMRQNATAIEELTPAQEKVLAALLAGRSVTDAATAGEVDRTTVHRWLKEDFGFQAALNRSRRQLREAMHSRLMALAEKAAETVERAISADGDSKTALALLKRLGLLNGELPSIGSADPRDLKEEHVRKKRFRGLWE